DEIAGGLALEDGTLLVDQSRFAAEERPGRRPRLEPCCPRQRRYQDSASFGLPPRIDDRAAAIPDNAMIPLPRLGGDRLANRAQKPQRSTARALYEVVARAHERTDRGRRRVEGVDLPLVDDVPEARCRRIVRHALEHQGDGPVRERTIENVAVPGHPA